MIPFIRLANLDRVKTAEHRITLDPAVPLPFNVKLIYQKNGLPAFAQQEFSGPLCAGDTDNKIVRRLMPALN